MIIGARQHAEHVAARQRQKGAKTVVFRPGSLPHDFFGIACRKTRSQFLACLKRGESAGGTFPTNEDEAGRSAVARIADAVWCAGTDFAFVPIPVDEVSVFPKAKHDDLTDCVSMGLLYLRKHGFIAMPKEVEDERRWRETYQSSSFASHSSVAERYGA